MTATRAQNSFLPTGHDRYSATRTALFIPFDNDLARRTKAQIAIQAAALGWIEVFATVRTGD
jgi:hypothetical protein